MGGGEARWPGDCSYDWHVDALLWLLPVVALLGAGYFLVRAFTRTSAAMREVREQLAEINEMGPRLQRLAGEMNNLTETLEEKRRR